MKWEKLAHVHRVTTHVAQAAKEIFIFDHHRTAFTIWAAISQSIGRPLTLVTLDRHMDLMVPSVMPGLPSGPGSKYPDARRPTLEELDTFARMDLSPRNDDHIVAAMEAGSIGDALIVARSHQPHSLEPFRPYSDHCGRRHRCVFAKSVELLGPEHLEVLEGADKIALDIDLDCFTTLSDGHHDEVLAWGGELIETFLCPADSERFWMPVLEKVEVITIAREPYHCGGFDRGAQLWRAFSEVFFGKVLKVPSP